MSRIDIDATGHMPHGRALRPWMVAKTVVAGGPAMLACGMLLASVVAEALWFIREAYFPY